jgi:hypothetical protein
VGKTYPQLWKQYVMVDPAKKISYIYKAHEARIYKEEQAQITLETYNEFDL